MSGTRWGVDSLDFADLPAPSSCCCGSGTLAWYTKNCWYAPDSIAFWGRYFTNVDYPNGTWRNSESQALLNAGINWVLPISNPGQTRIGGGTYGNGFSDGQAFCQAIMKAINGNHQLHLPGSCELHVFLDIEGSTVVSKPYWQGWATAVNQFNVTCGGGTGALPMFACAYIGSIGTGSNNCGLIASVSSGWATCYGTWSNQPQLKNGCCGSCPGCCGGCSSPGPSWAPNNCSQFQTKAWQYGDAGVCMKYCGSGSSCCPRPNVDLDSTNPAITGPFGNDETDYLIWVH